MNLATPPAAATAPKIPTAPAPAPGAPPAGAPAGAKPDPSGKGAPKPDLAKVVGMPVADAVAAATGHLTKVQTLTIGGGTKEGVAAAQTAATLLKDTSMLVQVIHRNAVPTQISPELELNLMAVATGIAAASTQVALMGQASKQPIALKDMLAEPAKQATDLLGIVADHVGRAQKQDANPGVAAGYL